MLILGINGGFRPGYQDVSACLVENGRVLAAVEEERLSRIKFSAGKLPFLAIREVLKIADKRITEVDVIAFHGSNWEPVIDERINTYFRFHFGYAPAVKRYHHHDCHAASTYYASGIKDALVVTLDNSGDGTSLQVAEGRNGSLRLIERFLRPNSMGIFYSVFTQLCGFVKDSDEYKLMGLSSYGTRNKFDFSWLIDFKDGVLKLNTDFIHTVRVKEPSRHRDEMHFNDAFLAKMGAERRLPGGEFNQFYKDVAASAQQHFEAVMLKLVKYYSDKTGLKKVCLAGGAALNCVMNQQLMNAKWCEEIFVQPASSDAGISLGAAWLAGLDEGIVPVSTENTFLGSEYTNDEIEQTLISCNLRYKEVKDAAEKAAELISQNKVIGWFQGRMEFGPRALGSRSILANAQGANMQDIVNRKIKLRESFRPFCPSVLEEDAGRYFSGKQLVAPYMTITYNVKQEMQKVIPAVTHVDGTARIQTVSERQHPLYYNFLQKLKTKTGHGVALNTSFNLSHEPIVCTPRDAIATFFSSGLDNLVIGSFVLSK